MFVTLYDSTAMTFFGSTWTSEPMVAPFSVIFLIFKSLASVQRGRSVQVGAHMCEVVNVNIDQHLYVRTRHIDPAACLIIEFTITERSDANVALREVSIGWTVVPLLSVAFDALRDLRNFDISDRRYLQTTQLFYGSPRMLQFLRPLPCFQPPHGIADSLSALCFKSV